MSTNYYIPSLETIVNSDHIIRATFTPAHEYEDDYEAGKMHQAPDYLDLQLTELSGDRFEGGFGTSTRLRVRGPEAAYLWNVLMQGAFIIPAFTKDTEPA